LGGLGALGGITFCLILKLTVAIRAGTEAATPVTRSKRRPIDLSLGYRG